MAAKAPRSLRTASSSWSATGASVALSCPLRYFLETIIPEETRQNPLAVWGKALHYMFQLFFTPNRSTGNYPYQQLDAFLGAWAYLWWGAVGDLSSEPDGRITARNQRNPFDSMRQFASRRNLASAKPAQPEDVAWSYLGQPGALFFSGQKVLTNFFDRNERRRRDGTRRLLETEFRRLPWHGLYLNGKIDRIDIQPDGAFIVDYKNGRHHLPELESGIQLTFYQLAFPYLKAQGKIPPDAILRRMYILDYRSSQAQRARLRLDYEIGMLYITLLKLKVYWDAVLFARRNHPKAEAYLTDAQQQDMLDGEARPNLPRGRHCDYCAVYQQCRKWEQGQRLPAREAFARFHQLRRQKLMLTQTTTLVPVIQEPLIVERGAEYNRIAGQILPRQIDLDMIVHPQFKPRKVRRSKRAG